MVFNCVLSISVGSAHRSTKNGIVAEIINAAKAIFKEQFVLFICFSKFLCSIDL